MASGYVYILVNQSLVGLLKIGRTVRDSRARARELSTTGVPTPFQVAFEVFSDDIAQLERRIHEELIDFRVASNREFFRYPLDKAINLVQKLNGVPADDDSFYEAEDILFRLKAKYEPILKTDIVAVRVVQSKDRVWLEITREMTTGKCLDQEILRKDMGNFGWLNRKLFDEKDSALTNASKLVDGLDPSQLLVMTQLFDDDKAVPWINERYGTNWITGKPEPEAGDV